MIRVPLVLSILILTLSVACSSRAPEAAKREQQPTAAQYVDAAACAPCHAAQAKAHAQTGMGRAFKRATPAALDRENFLPGGNTYFHKASDRTYQMVRRGDRFFQRRFQSAAGSGEINVVEKEIHYVMGSGNHARTYLHRTPDNRLIQLPLGWYAEGGGTWAMNPGYDRPDHAGFRRDVGYGCMFCHNGYPAELAGGGAQEAAPVYPASLPEGIDCQRCHGPGAAHVAAAKQGQTEQLKTTILQPRQLSRERQIEVCLQCHLETTSFSLPHAVTRLERAVFSYSPAEPLADYAIHFDHAPGTGHEGKFEIVNAAYRLRQSACFLKSATMTCSTCHPAHHAASGPEASRAYVAACRQCHRDATLSARPAHRAGNQDCSGCHMPKRRTEDVVHVVMTDHLIQRRPPAARELLAARTERVESDEVSAYRGEVALYYPPKLENQADRELYTALAQVAQKSNLKPGIARLEAAIAKHPVAGAPFAPHLATALLSAGEPARARAIFAKLAERNPKDAGALRGLADVDATPEAVRRLLEVAPGDAAALYQLAQLTRQTADAARAVAAAPESPDALNLLASLQKEAGNLAEAEGGYRKAIRHQPDLAALHENLAGVLGAAGRFEEAAVEFERAAKLSGTSANARFGRAAALAALGRFTEARNDALAAVRLQPGHAAAWELQGNLAARGGAWVEAGAAFQKALTAQPGFARAELGLGTVLAAQRDWAGARLHLEKAALANDPAVRQEAAEMLREVAARGGGGGR